ncbi:MAG: hypothetical protein WKF87_09120 [Chryseolinea sp.]
MNSKETETNPSRSLTQVKWKDITPGFNRAVFVSGPYNSSNELTDEEIPKMEAALQTVFEIQVPIRDRI